MPDESGAYSMDDIMALADRLNTQPAQQQEPMRRSTSTLGILGQIFGGGPSGAVNMSEDEQEHQARRALMAWGGAMARGGSWSPYGARNIMDLMGDANAAGWGASEDYEKSLIARAKDAREAAQQDRDNRYKSISAAAELVKMQQSLNQLRIRSGGLPSEGGGTTAGGAKPGTSIGTPGGAVSPFIATNLPNGISVTEDQIVRTIIGEAGGESHDGQQAVASVIKNRMDKGKQSSQDVIFSPYQFSVWNQNSAQGGARDRLAAIDPNSAQYQQILNGIVRPTLAGDAKDPTNGATHYFSQGAADKLKLQRPGWAQGDAVATIGGHQFYSPGYGGGGGSQSPPGGGRVQVASRDTGTATDATPAPVAPA